MTRINLVPVKNLFDQHLLAEHREIKRIPNVIKSGKFKFSDIPESYVLGKGHVKFFYDKILFLHKRYKKLYKECKKRNFNIENYNESFLNIDKKYYNDYFPSEEEIKLNQKRLDEKYKKKFYRYYGIIK